MTGYLAASWLVLVVVFVVVPDVAAAGRRRGRREAAEIADDDAHWGRVRADETDLDRLHMQRMTLLDDDRHAYTDRYLDSPVTGDWPGFAEDEKARLDAEIAELSQPVTVPEAERDDAPVRAA